MWWILCMFCVVTSHMPAVGSRKSNPPNCMFFFLLFFRKYKVLNSRSWNWLSVKTCKIFYAHSFLFFPFVFENSLVGSCERFFAGFAFLLVKCVLDPRLDFILAFLRAACSCVGASCCVGEQFEQMQQQVLGDCTLSAEVCSFFFFCFATIEIEGLCHNFVNAFINWGLRLV